MSLQVTVVWGLPRGKTRSATHADSNELPLATSMHWKWMNVPISSGLSNCGWTTHPSLRLTERWQRQFQESCRGTVGSTPLWDRTLWGHSTFQLNLLCPSSHPTTHWQFPCGQLSALADILVTNTWSWRARFGFSPHELVLCEVTNHPTTYIEKVPKSQHIKA